MLLFLRRGLAPIIQKAKSFLSIAQSHALEKMKLENIEGIYTGYDVEYQKDREDLFVKNHLQDSMVSQEYDLSWFSLQKNSIVDRFDQNNYQDLMVFALL